MGVLCQVWVVRWFPQGSRRVSPRLFHCSGLRPVAFGLMLLRSHSTPLHVPFRPLASTEVALGRGCHRAPCLTTADPASALDNYIRYISKRTSNATHIPMLAHTVSFSKLPASGGLVVRRHA